MIQLDKPILAMRQYNHNINEYDVETIQFKSDEALFDFLLELQLNEKFKEIFAPWISDVEMMIAYAEVE